MFDKRHLLANNINSLKYVNLDLKDRLEKISNIAPEVGTSMNFPRVLTEVSSDGIMAEKHLGKSGGVSKTATTAHIFIRKFCARLEMFDHFRWSSYTKTRMIGASICALQHFKSDSSIEWGR